jgi:enediyne biosynthesis protein E4
VRVQAGAGKQWNMVRSGSSYLSASDLALTFGLGKAVTAALEVEWPSGTRQQFANVAADQFLTIDEARGILPRR